MQHNNLLKKAMLAMLLCVAMPYAKSQVAHVGDILCEGNLIYPPSTYPVSGATAIGVIFYVDDTGLHGWAVALQDALDGSECAWGPCNETPLPNFTNKRQAIYDLDGYHNTQVILEYSAGFPAFNAVNFEDGWYLPAIGQLNYLYGNLVEVNKSFIVVGGTVFSTTNWEYWSSTEYNSEFAWIWGCNGDLGYYSYRCAFSRRVRSVRNF